ncbi:sensor domain-containing protein [Paractinoplanes maris]|uniref:sensor domain-containing protein n=1 Tax=Paractinoplanes maris TaxID=1734446 RepID=UPI0020205F4C|nr:sensor domain-containing protein [Actinoplanes maris]
MTTTQLETAPQLDMRPTAAQLETPLAKQVADNSRYVLSGFPIALASSVIVLAAFVAGLSLVVVWIGVPLLVLALTRSRTVAAAERARVAEVLGVPMPAPAPRTGRLTALITDGPAWRELAHAILRLVPSTIAFSVVVTWWAGMLGGVSFALWGWSLPGDDLPELLGLSDTYPASIAFYLAAGVLFALTLPAVVSAAAHFEARFARRLLSR